jgi:hypothetical protein
MILDWLRRWLCRCPEPEPLIQNTGYTGTFTITSGPPPPAGSLLDTMVEADERWQRPRHLHAVPDDE